jgi:hypothetical protein
MLFQKNPLNTTTCQKKANIANILPILVILCKEKKNILDVIFLGDNVTLGQKSRQFMWKK